MANIRSPKILKAAKGEQCCMQIYGVCNYDPETTVACHVPDMSHGMGIKAHDLLVIFGCSSCHAAMDGAVPCPDYQENKYLYLFRGLKRTWLRLIEKGVIKIV